MNFSGLYSSSYNIYANSYAREKISVFLFLELKTFEACVMDQSQNDYLKYLGIEPNPIWSAYSLYMSQLKKKVFISFDYDHDEELKNLLVGQAENPETPFSIVDKSIKEPFVGNWIDKVRARIRNVNVVIVICGMNMATARGVDVEIKIAQEEQIPYFLLCGYSHGRYVRPFAAQITDKVYDWTWNNLKLLIAGNR